MRRNSISNPSLLNYQALQPPPKTSVVKEISTSHEVSFSQKNPDSSKGSNRSEDQNGNLKPPPRRKLNALPSGTHIHRRPLSAHQYGNGSTPTTNGQSSPQHNRIARDRTRIGLSSPTTDNRRSDVVRPLRFERRADPSPAPSRPPRANRRKMAAFNSVIHELQPQQGSRHAPHSGGMTPGGGGGSNTPSKDNKAGRMAFPSSSAPSIGSTGGAASGGQSSSSSIGAGSPSLVRRAGVAGREGVQVGSPSGTTAGAQPVRRLPTTSSLKVKEPSEKRDAEDRLQQYITACEHDGEPVNEEWVSIVQRYLHPGHETMDATSPDVSLRSIPDLTSVTSYEYGSIGKILRPPGDNSKSKGGSSATTGSSSKTVQSKTGSRRTPGTKVSGEDQQCKSAAEAVLDKMALYCRQRHGAMRFKKDVIMQKRQDVTSALEAFRATYDELVSIQSSSATTSAPATGGTGTTGAPSVATRKGKAPPPPPNIPDPASNEARVEKMRANADRLTNSLHTVQQAVVQLLLRLQDYAKEVRKPLGIAGISDGSSGQKLSPSTSLMDSSTGLQRTSTAPALLSSTEKKEGGFHEENFFTNFTDFVAQQEKEIAAQLREVQETVGGILGHSAFIAVEDEGILQTPLFCRTTTSTSSAARGGGNESGARGAKASGAPVRHAPQGGTPSGRTTVKPKVSQGPHPGQLISGRKEKDAALKSASSRTPSPLFTVSMDHPLTTGPTNSSGDFSAGEQLKLVLGRAASSSPRNSAPPSVLDANSASRGGKPRSVVQRKGRSSSMGPQRRSQSASFHGEDFHERSQSSVQHASATTMAPFSLLSKTQLEQAKSVWTAVSTLLALEPSEHLLEASTGMDATGFAGGTLAESVSSSSEPPALLETVVPPAHLTAVTVEPGTTAPAPAVAAAAGPRSGKDPLSSLVVLDEKATTTVVPPPPTSSSKTRAKELNKTEAVTVVSGGGGAAATRKAATTALASSKATTSHQKSPKGDAPAAPVITPPQGSHRDVVATVSPQSATRKGTTATGKQKSVFTLSTSAGSTASPRSATTRTREAVSLKDPTSKPIISGSASPSIAAPTSPAIVSGGEKKPPTAQEQRAATRIASAWRGWRARRGYAVKTATEREEKLSRQEAQRRRVAGKRIIFFLRGIVAIKKMRRAAAAAAKEKLREKQRSEMVCQKNSALTSSPPVSVASSRADSVSRTATARDRFLRAKEQRRAMNAELSTIDTASETSTVITNPSGRDAPSPHIAPVVNPLPLFENGISTNDIMGYNRDSESFELQVLHRLLRAPPTLVYLLTVITMKNPHFPPMGYAAMKDKNTPSFEALVEKVRQEKKRKQEVRAPKPTIIPPQLRGLDGCYTLPFSLVKCLQTPLVILPAVQSQAERNGSKEPLRSSASTTSSVPWSPRYQSYVRPNELREPRPVVKDFKRPFERWGTSNALVRRLFTAAAIYSWKLIFSHTPHDDFKQRQLQTAEEQAARLDRVDQRNRMILACYCVHSEREWLREASKDISFVGQIWNPKKSLDPNDPDLHRHCKETFEFVEDFLYQCFPTVSALEEVPSFLLGAGIFFLLRESLNYSEATQISHILPWGSSFLAKPYDSFSSSASSAGKKERALSGWAQVIQQRFELCDLVDRVVHYEDARYLGKVSKVLSSSTLPPRGDHASSSSSASPHRGSASLEALFEKVASHSTPSAVFDMSRYRKQQKSQSSEGVDGMMDATLESNANRVMLLGVPVTVSSHKYFFRDYEDSLQGHINRWVRQKRDAKQASVADTDVEFKNFVVLYPRKYLVTLAETIAKILFGVQLELEVCEELDCLD